MSLFIACTLFFTVLNYFENVIASTAPVFSPELKLASVDASHAEVQWEPIPLDKRNGFITNYTVFWIDKLGKENCKHIAHSFY